MKEIHQIHDLLNDLPALAGSIKQNGKKIIGYLCSYVPEELIIAAGFHPMRLFPQQLETPLAEARLQSYCCSPVKRILEDSLSGRLDFLDGTIFPQTCDTIQRLSDLWRMDDKYSFFADLSWPTKLDTQSSQAYVVSILNRFKTQLEQAADKRITDADLAAAIQTCNQIRTHILKLYQLNAQKPGILTASDLYTIIKATMILDKDQIIPLLAGIEDQFENQNDFDLTAKRIIVSGASCDFPAITPAIEAAGGCIVGDDFCTGQRWHEGQTRTNGDLITAIADRYIDRMICPAKHISLTARADQILKLHKDLKADGVVFLLTKFCDPHAFDYPGIKTCLDNKKIKSISIETDGPFQGDGQISTRLETFIQTI